MMHKKVQQTINTTMDDIQRIIKCTNMTMAGKYMSIEEMVHRMGRDIHNINRRVSRNKIKYAQINKDI